MSRSLLAEPGPAQFEWLVHFCGRPPGAAQSIDVRRDIALMSPDQRLRSILLGGAIFGFPPFGARDPVVSLSECTKDHMEWLIAQRGWSPWGILLRRQDVYDMGGGPVWYARTQQYEALPESLRPWAVRLETAPRRSDWLHEREWRLPSAQLTIPVEPDEDGLRVGVLVGEQNWQPLSGSEQPLLWENSYRGYWDTTKNEIAPLPRI